MNKTQVISTFISKIINTRCKSASMPNVPRRPALQLSIELPNLIKQAHFIPKPPFSKPLIIIIS